MSADMMPKLLFRQADINEDCVISASEWDRAMAMKRVECGEDGFRSWFDRAACAAADLMSINVGRVRMDYKTAVAANRDSWDSTTSPISSKRTAPGVPPPREPVGHSRNTIDSITAMTEELATTSPEPAEFLQTESLALKGWVRRLGVDYFVTWTSKSHVLVHLKTVSYTHLRAHETPEHLVCRLLLEKKKNKIDCRL
eukprot:TRINITY_DN18212_c0_g1_i3.p1 TRINITY_DN18212_c0_g1~~TRINITY_DN18212_c0_g1_i3.p1  ORF type:complete len:198 (+),score=41.07 TRINITY_DN18212_c0_g1_i3:444-1037(+)